MEAQYSTMNRAGHALHEARNAVEFRSKFEAATGVSVDQVVDAVVRPDAPKATFVVGSLPLGMATSGSDVDLIVLVDDKTALVQGENRIANNAQHLEFSSESAALIPAIVLTTTAGIVVDLNVAVTPVIHSVYGRLRQRGPELSDTEIRTLGRISSGWLLGQTPEYMDRNASILTDPALGVYCCTRRFVSALLQSSKASRGLHSDDIPLALQHARTAVEDAYMAYFASEGLTFLGSKWLAQLGSARGASERLRRHPQLVEGIALLFPQYPASRGTTESYLQSVAAFITSIRALIEQKTLFRIAFNACPQIHAP